MPDKDGQIKEYEAQFNKIVDAAGKDDKSYLDADLSPFETPLGKSLRSEFERVMGTRRMSEQKWLKDLRQYRGEYDPEVKSKMHPKRSKAFLSLTRTKVKTITARQTDLLFPANGNKNWGILPSPIPELDATIVQSIALQYQEQTGEKPTDEMIRKFINDEAVRRSDAMSKEMEDQLSEIKYREIIRNVILCGNLYGTGILKGPLAKTTTTTRYIPHGDDYVPVQLTRTVPYAEYVPIWDVYLDMSATRPENMKYVYQRYVMPRAKVWQLASRSDFNTDAIRAYLKSFPEGDAEFKNYENDLRSLNIEGTAMDDTTPGRKGRYEVAEYWGYINSDKLAAMGVEVDEEQLGIEVMANIWLLGDVVIKAVISPIEGASFPYHIYYYDKDDSSIYAEGIPAIMRDPQKLFNAGVRAMLDNAAISAGPIIEANMDLLDPDEDPRDLYPFRVFMRTGQGAEAAYEAIRVTSLPSYVNEFMTMITFFRDMADEIPAIPRYLWGEGSQIGGAGRTATGLSMMMGAANITLKDQVKYFDDGITSPFIKALYFWNMQFNPKPHIKGDFNVVARGSTSLIAREVQSESLNQFLSIVGGNELLLPYLKLDNILRQMVKIMDLDELDLIKDPNEVAIQTKSREADEIEDKEFEKNLAMTKARSGGHMDEAVRTPGQRPHMQPLSGEELERGVVPGVDI